MITSHQSFDWIKPQWPAPASVMACTTTRTGGQSPSPYADMNLAQHVGDNSEMVKQNRQILQQTLNIHSEPCWLNQCHTSEVYQVTSPLPTQPPTADASFTREAGAVCVVLTADCLPVLLCDKAGSVVAAVHAGWKGLAAGIIEKTVECMDVPYHQILVWLGPAIGPKKFEVGEEVRETFITHHVQTKTAFIPQANQKYLADLYQIAKIRLAALGVEQVYGGGYCTFTEENRFYSYRRDSITGRMASLISLGTM